MNYAVEMVSDTHIKFIKIGSRVQYFYGGGHTEMQTKTKRETGKQTHKEQSDLISLLIFMKINVG
jgi:hypothetical protein